MEDYPFEAMFLAARASRHLKDWTPRRWIKALRKSLGMTQAALAGRAGLRQADVERALGRDEGDAG